MNENENKLKYYKLYKISIILWTIMITYFLVINSLLSNLSSKVDSIISALFIYTSPIISIFLLVISIICIKNKVLSKKIIPIITTTLGAISAIWSLYVIVLIHIIRIIAEFYLKLIF